MPYTLTPWMKAPRAPGIPGVQGYFYNHGGLNNQKMALVGLMLTGIARGEPINLPTSTIATSAPKRNSSPASTTFSSSNRSSISPPKMT